MKIRLLLATLVCSAITVPGLFAEDAKAKAAEPASDKTAIEVQMEKMNSAFRRIRTQVADPAKADPAKMQSTIADVGTLRQAAEAALKSGGDPKMKAEIPAAEQAAWVAKYQADMKKLIAEIVKLEDALKSGKGEEASQIFAAIGKMQKDGHTAYKAKAKKKE